MPDTDKPEASLIEAVAKAIQRHHHYGGKPCQTHCPICAEAARSASRVVLKRMRKPDKAMLAVIDPTIDAQYNGVKAEPDCTYVGTAVFQAMLDAFRDQNDLK